MGVREQDTGDPNWEEWWLPRWTSCVDLSRGEGVRCAVGRSHLRRKRPDPSRGLVASPPEENGCSLTPEERLTRATHPCLSGTIRAEESWGPLTREGLSGLGFSRGLWQSARMGGRGERGGSSGWKPSWGIQREGVAGGLGVVREGPWEGGAGELEGGRLRVLIEGLVALSPLPQSQAEGFCAGRGGCPTLLCTHTSAQRCRPSLVTLLCPFSSPP